MGLIPVYLGPSEAVKEDLMALDGFDLAFLILAGQVVFTDNLDASFELVQKAAKAKSALWGPQATLLGLLFKRAWKGEGQFLKEILDAFDRSGDVSVDSKKVDRAFKTHLPKMGQRIWQRVAGEIDPILTDISLGSAANCLKQFKRQVRKADSPVDPLEILFGATPAGAPFLVEDFMSYYERATGNHLNAFTSAFPERTLHPEVERLVKYAEQAPGMRVIDKADLTKRIERISNFGNNYFANMTDIQAGHLWNFTALEMAHNAGVSRYQVLSQRDKKTCPVCKRLDGKTFNVKQAYDKIQNNLASVWQQAPLSEMALMSPITLANATAKAFPFPRMNQIDNMSSAQVRASGWFAPFHSRPYSADTEIFTNEGWKYVIQLTGDELFLSPNPATKALSLEWVYALRTTIHDPKGEMVHFKSQNSDLLVAKEHDQIYSTNPHHGSKWGIKQAQELLNLSVVYIPRCGSWRGNSVRFVTIKHNQYPAQAFFRFMAFWLSDGSVVKRYKNSYYITIAKQTLHSETLREVKLLGVKAYSRPKGVEFYDPILGAYLMRFGHAPHKYIPNVIKNASTEQIIDFLSTYLTRDGHIQSQYGGFNAEKGSLSKVFYTTSTRLADDLGELILKAGGYPSFITQKQAGKFVTINGHSAKCNYDIHRIYWNKSKTATFGKHGKGTMRIVPYAGRAYCVELERNHILWIRRNGKTCFSGNCRCQTIMLWKKGAQAAPLVPYEFKDLQMHYGTPSTLGAKFMGPLQKKVKDFAKSEVASEKVMWSAYKNCQTTDHPLVVLMHKETGDVVALARVRKLKTTMSIDQLGMLGNASGADKQMLQTVCLIAKKDGLAVQMEVAAKNVASIEALGAEKLKSGMYKFYKHQVADMADNLNPLIGDITFMSWETTAAQEVISVATAVPKKPKTIPKPKVKTEPVKPKVPPAPTEVPKGKWEMIPDTQLGSNPGGQYIGPDGNKYYAKFYKNVDQAQSELASAQLAEKFGLQTFETKVISIPDPDGNIGTALVTKWKNGGEGGAVRLSTLAADEVEDLTKQYLHACLTGNWDVMGAHYDNLVYFGKRWQCVDYGGTFKFRAQGGVKDFLAGEPSELASLLDPKHKAGSIFSKFVPDELSINAKKYMKWMGTVTDGDINKLVTILDDPIEIAGILKARRNAIIFHLEKIIEAKKPSKTIKRRVIKKAELFAAAKDQKAFDLEYEKYARVFKNCPKDDLEDAAWATARTVLRKDMKKNKKITTFLEHWVDDATRPEANAIRLKAVQMEKTDLNMVWKDYMDVSEVRRFTKQIPDIEYVRVRAATQAYLDARGDTTLLWRGISGDTGHVYREKLQDIKRKATQGKWRKKFMEIDEGGMCGWSSKRNVSEDWADVLMRDDKPNLEVILHNDVWPKTSHQGEVETLCLGFNKRKLQLGRELAEKQDIFN